MGRNTAAGCKPKLDGIFNNLAVQHGKRARQRQTYGAHIGVCRIAEPGGTATESFALCIELTVNLKTHH